MRESTEPARVDLVVLASTEKHEVLGHVPLDLWKRVIASRRPLGCLLPNDVGQLAQRELLVRELALEQVAAADGAAPC